MSGIGYWRNWLIALQLNESGSQFLLVKNSLMLLNFTKTDSLTPFRLNCDEELAQVVIPFGSRVSMSS